MNRRGLSLGKRAAFLTAIFAGFLFLLEALMIVLEPVLSTGIYQFDPDLGFRIRARKNGTNRHGFNDRDYPLERTRDTYRILFLGDSFSWAGGLEKNYTAILEDKFKNHYGDPRVEVVNAGYPMTHPGDQRSLLRERRISFAVGIYPDEFQVDKALLEEVYAYAALKKGLKKTEFDIEFTQRLLRAFLDDKKIPYVDLLDPFKKKGKTERLYIPQDTHWNEGGNELAARVTAGGDVTPGRS